MNFIKLYKKNLGFSLLITNIILFIILVLIQDPFSIFSKTYEKAPKLLSIDLSQIDKIEIEITEKNLKYQIQKIAQKKEEFKDLNEFIENTDWTFTLFQKDKKENYTIDKENLKNFLEELINLKKYYYIAKNPENDGITGISEQSPRIFLYFKGNLKYDIFIGNTSLRNQTSYVYLRNDDKIYQIEGNLKSKFGYEDIYYFRNHKLFNIDKQKIFKLNVILPNKTILYSKTGSDWQTLQPKPEKLQASSFEGILEEITNLKANRFYGLNLPKEELEKLKFQIEIYYNESENIGTQKKEILEIIGKKDYVKYFIKFNNEFYEVSLYKIEDLLEPEKLIEKK